MAMRHDSAYPTLGPADAPHLMMVVGAYVKYLLAISKYCRRQAMR